MELFLAKIAQIIKVYTGILNKNHANILTLHLLLKTTQIYSFFKTIVTHSLTSNNDISSASFTGLMYCWLHYQYNMN